ncbi:O-antigen ligase [Schaalia sp. Marseille-Q2122]|uniref:O-antigen ligase family protein n=1 Tax=Schaalia sp. Marseille-Q2122 TaxID=2736604 RepID=UPI00158ECF2D|nr:O-antigen ligase domain-containing protein [Schaalia sp. Marseille-Q2122]
MKETLPTALGVREERLTALWKERERGGPFDNGRGHRADLMAAWPFHIAFAGYFLWWLLGPGDMVWLAAAILMAMFWVGARGFAFPRGALLWALFLVWVVVSLSMIDTSGRMVGALYRFLLLLAATVFGLHVYNARRSLSLRAISAAMTLFLLAVTAGGFLAMAQPDLVIKTPMAYIVPSSLLDNELVRDMAIRHTTQWDPTLLVQGEPRPSAPFLYANTWGNIYSLLLPMSLLHARLEWDRRSLWRWPVTVLCLVSTIPAVYTLNRGMFVGLAVVALWVAIQSLREGRWKGVVSGAGALGVAGVVWMVSPAGTAFFERLETTKSTVDRFSLYSMTLAELNGSPLLGFGAPRPSPFPWLPSLGTQGQFWTVLFSHGYVGATLFMGFLGFSFLIAFRRTDLAGAVYAGAVLATIVETMYYGMTTGLIVTFVAIAVIARGDVLPDPVVNIRGSRGRTGA